MYVYIYIYVCVCTELEDLPVVLHVCMTDCLQLCYIHISERFLQMKSLLYLAHEFEIHHDILYVDASLNM